MLTVLRQLISAEHWRGGNRLWYASLGASTLVHLGAIVVLGSWWWQARSASKGIAALDTHFSPQQTDMQVTQLELPRSTPSAAQQETGGSWAGSRLFRDTAPPSLNLPTVSTQVAVPPTWLGEFVPWADLGETVGAAQGGVGDPLQAGSGEGSGTGTGNGSGSGFFGIRAPGNRFVYVVDCSRSMNHPHPGEFKTRFNRLQFELIKSVAELEPQMEFFIIFFNDDPIPMPARSLQPALRNVQKRYLKWVTGKRPGGGTDPREALHFALRLKPDVIYFLTDGAFDKVVERDLKELAQSDVAIHTFTFGNRAAEELMKRIAARNGGQYHFVP